MNKRVLLVIDDAIVELVHEGGCVECYLKEETLCEGGVNGYPYRMCLGASGFLGKFGNLRSFKRIN